MAKPKTVLAGDMKALLDTGAMMCGAARVSYAGAEGDRLVVGFLLGDDTGAWLRDTCAENAFQLVTVTAPDLSDFDAVEVSSLLQAVAAHAIATRAASVTVCASGPAAHAAIKAAKLFANPILVGFDLPLSHDAKHADALIAGLAACQSGFIFYDPFHGADAVLRDVSDQNGIQWLKSFGLLGATLNRLWRMKLLAGILPAALRAELDAGYFYRLMRSRRNYRFYRTGIETALASRGQTARQKRFRTLFRIYIQSQDPSYQFEALQKDAAAARPAHPDAWAVAGDIHTDQTWPSMQGNVWMLNAQNGVIRYMSDHWDGITMGYEERAGVTLAQTAPLALGMISFGHGTQIARDVAKPFPWHVITSDLSGQAPAVGAVCEATLLCAHHLQNRMPLPTIMTFAEPKAGLAALEEKRGTPIYDALISDVQKGCDALHAWDKTLHVDRLRLSLLSGSPTTTLSDANDHYGAVAADLMTDIRKITGQDTPPVVVVMQSAGSRLSGQSEVILAEGRVDLDNPSLPVVVASPAYPWGVMDNTPATPSTAAAMIMDELSVHAVMAHQSGQRWFCPMMQSATVDGRKITVEFATMAGLVLEDGPHGFHILGNAEAPTITQVTVAGENRLTLLVDGDILEDNLSLAYAWGHIGQDGAAEGYANHGSLRDKWQAGSQSIQGLCLHRFALAGCVPLRPALR